MLSPLQYTHYDSNVIVKFADDTAVIRLITNGDETAYRQEVRGLELWFGENNLILNTKKMKELIVDFRRKGAIPPPVTLTTQLWRGFTHSNRPAPYQHAHLAGEHRAHHQEGPSTALLPKEVEGGRHVHSQSKILL